MLNRILNTSSYCAIEHNTIDGRERLLGLCLKKEAKKLEIDQAFETTSIDELSQYLKPKQSLFLVVNTNQVLFKTLDSALESKEALRLAFPNISLSDFYFECYQSNEKTYVSICRKEAVDVLIEKYQQLHYGIEGFTLGNLAVSQLAPLLQEGKISSSNAIIYFKNKGLNAIESGISQEQTVTINGLEISNRSTLSLAGILGSYLKTNTTTSNFKTYNDQLKEQVKQQHLFNLGLKISLATIFVLLLFSFLLFTGYRSKIEILTAELQLKNQHKTRLVALSKEVAKKEKLIKDYSLAASKSSWYLNHLGLTVPRSILLTEIDWQPLTGTVKEKESIEFNEDRILVNGVVTVGADFSLWIGQLEQKEWIQKVAINHYGVNKKKQTQFELELSFKQ